MKVIVSCWIICLFCGCIKETGTQYQAFWKNATSHNIKIVGYTRGVIQPSHIVELDSGEEFRVAYGQMRGIVDYGFEFDEFSTVDSLVVTFDQQYKVVHYLHTPASPAPKSYLFTSLRNLLHAKSYSYKSTEIEHGISTEWRYEFTEADYQFAL